MEARACFDEARGLDKDCAGAWEGLGRALIALGEEARGRLNLGTGRMLAGDLDTALAEIDRALEVEPDLSEAHANRGGVLKRLGRLDDAAAAYRAALAKDPNAVTVLQNLGLLLCVDLARWDEGLDVLRQLVRLDPSRWFKLPSEVRSRVDQA
jgi:Tfp pilus assembly protein PilF